MISKVHPIHLNSFYFYEALFNCFKVAREVFVRKKNLQIDNPVQRIALN